MEYMYFGSYPQSEVLDNNITNELNKLVSEDNWIDFNAYSMDEKGLFDLLIKVVNGEYKFKSEDEREIAFYKTGVTL